MLPYAQEKSLSAVRDADKISGNSLNWILLRACADRISFFGVRRGETEDLDHG